MTLTSLLRPRPVRARGNRRARRFSPALAAVLVAVGLSVVSSVTPARGTDAPGAWTAVEPIRDVNGIKSITLLDGGGLGCGTGSASPVCGFLLVTRFNEAELYDPDTGVSIPTGSPSEDLGPMDEDGRSAEVIALLLPAVGKVLVVNSGTGIGEIYDPSAVDGDTGRQGTWTKIADPQHPRVRAEVVVLADGKSVLLAGGCTAEHCLLESEIFDPTAEAEGGRAGAWHDAAPMILGRQQHHVTLLGDGTVLAVGGQADVACVLCVVPAVGSLFGIVTVPGLAAERFSPPTPAQPLGSWSPAGPTRVQTSSALGALRRVLVTLPTGDAVMLSTSATTADVFETKTGQWRATGSMTFPREEDWLRATTTVLPPTPTHPGGRLLVAGGSGGAFAGDQPLASVEIYDPEAQGTDDTTGEPVQGAWVTAPSMITARAGHRAALLGDGRVLVAGGLTRTPSSANYNLNLPRTESAEAFDPGLSVQPPSIVSLTPGSGSAKGGSEVVISGAGFVDVTEVKFGAKKVPYHRVESSRRIVAVPPPQDPGDVAVTVTTAAGESPSLSVSRYTYTNSNGAWRPVDSLLDERSFHTATLLAPSGCADGSVAIGYPCGKVVVAGGRHRNDTALATVEMFDPATGKWEPSEPLRTPRFSHAATLLPDGRILVTGGRGSDLAPVKETELYDPASGSWQPAGELTTARAHHSSTALPDGSVLVVGGCADAVLPDAYDCQNHLSTAQVFHPTDGWQAEMRAGTTDTGVARARHTATRLSDGKVLFVGGVTTTIQVYDPAAGPGQRWIDAGELRVGRWERGRRDAVAALLPGERVLFAGGRDSTRPVGRSDVIDPQQVSDPATGTGGLVVPRSYGAVVALGDTVVVVGGCTSWGKEGTSSCTEATAAAERYDAEAGKWTLTDPLVQARAAHTATALGDGRILVVGGYNRDGVLAAAEVFDANGHDAPPAIVSMMPPAASTAGGTEITVQGAGFLSPATTVTFGGVPARSVTVRSDRELVAVTPAAARGPVDVVVSRDGVASAASPFTYARGAWSPTAPITACGADPCARYSHTATQLADGKVLVTGGYVPGDCTGVGNSKVTGGDSCAPMQAAASAALFDPFSGRWIQTNAMLKRRVHHSATPLADGTVLIVGGDTSNDETDADNVGTSEIFDPNAVDPRTGVRGTFRLTGPLATQRSEHTATLLPDGDVLVVAGWAPCSACGRQGNGGRRPGRAVLDTVERYDVEDGTWAPAPSLKVARSEHAAVSLKDGSVVVVGGCGRLTTSADFGALSLTCKLVLRSAERLTPTGWVEDGQALSAPRSAVSATLVPGSDGNERVLVAGGCGRYETTDRLVVHCVAESRAAELYDPIGRSSRHVAPMHVARAGHTASVMPDGRVLVLGSGTYRERPLRSAELFDPAAKTWELASVPDDSRDNHTTTVLDDGRVLVIGGAGPGGFIVLDNLLAIGDYNYYRLPRPLASVEVYTPAPDVIAVSPSSGPSAGGTTVTISGRHLGGATAVAFGSVVLDPSHFSVKSPTEITVTTPAHVGGTVDVVVTTAGGTSLTKTPKPYRFTFVSSGVPGPVDDLVARALGESANELRFTTAGSDGSLGPPATRYVVKQSRTPIDDSDAFAAAEALCDGECVFVDANMGRAVTLTIAGLAPGSTYHYALRAVGPNGALGPMSNSASATTLGSPPPAPVRTTASCPEVPSPGDAGIRYPAGYSMVGLPEGTRLAADSPLYSWVDRGAGGSYSVHDSNEAFAAGYGYWAWFSCPRLVSIAGPGQSRVQSTLDGYHASMVGNPSSEGHATVSGHDFAARWDPMLNGGSGGYHISGYREPQALAVGEATWVFSYRSTTIEVAR